MANQPGVLTPGQMNDLVTTTLPYLGKPNYTEIVASLQRYTAMSNLMRRNRVQVEAGYTIQFRVMVNPARAARNIGFGGVADIVDIPDLFTYGSADWRHTEAHYAIDGPEIDMNKEPARIVDEIAGRRAGTMLSLTELMESNFWGPPVSANDNVTPWGVNMWIVKSATQGFNGGAPSGYTTIGLNPTNYPNWNNWTDAYTNISPDDLIPKWTKASRKTDFKPPVEGIKSPNTGDDYGYFCNEPTYGPLEQMLRAQNDNLGNDVVQYFDQVHFRRTPLVWVPKLDADTTNPIYGINWGWFKTFVLSNWWMRETHLPIYPGQHTMSAHFLDCIYQFVVRNRRCMFVLSNGTSYPS